ncbi:Titin [Geodia barretti]|uniref:Titin n=1 Tax=Geodia barretti TaxID=519541 RepID=A0AA35TF79_GEOBA|nr:Titin [Geodia barretti]
MNHLGNTVQECQITLLEPPPPPTEVNGVILGSYNSALVSWLSCGDGPCPITRYLLQLRRTDSSTKSWTQVADDITSTAHVVENLERGVAYVFRVCAMNEVGCGRFSQPSLPLTITDEPDYDSDGPEMEDVRRIIQPLALDSYLSSLNSSSHQ